MNIEKEIYGKVAEINDLLKRLDFERSLVYGGTEIKPQNYFLLENDFDFIKAFYKICSKKNTENIKKN